MSQQHDISRVCSRLRLLEISLTKELQLIKASGGTAGHKVGSRLKLIQDTREMLEALEKKK